MKYALKLNTKLSLYSLYCANAYICECRCVSYSVTTQALPLDEEGVPEGGGRFALRVTYGSAIGSMGINKKKSLAALFCYSHSTRIVEFWLNILTLLSIL